MASLVVTLLKRRCGAAHYYSRPDGWFCPTILGAAVLSYTS